MPDCDAIVIGAGHNGLAAATLLAKRGLHVLCVEKNRYVGGMAATVELFDGYRFEIAGSVLFPLATQVVEDLALEEHGLDPIPASVMSCNVGDPGDPPIVLYADPLEQAKHVTEAHGAEAAEAMLRLFQYCQAPADAMDRFRPLSPPRKLSAILEAAGSGEEREAIRKCFFGSAMDVIGEFFPDPSRNRVIRAFLAFLAVQSAYRGPEARPVSPTGSPCRRVASS